MTANDVTSLRALLTEKQDRLSAAYRRLRVLRDLVLSAESPEELDVYGKEVNDLGNEVKELLESSARLKKLIDSFYAKPAQAC